MLLVQSLHLAIWSDEHLGDVDRGRYGATEVNADACPDGQLLASCLQARHKRPVQGLGHLVALCATRLSVNEVVSVPIGVFWQHDEIGTLGLRGAEPFHAGPEIFLDVHPREELRRCCQPLLLEGHAEEVSHGALDYLLATALHGLVDADVDPYGRGTLQRTRIPQNEILVLCRDVLLAHQALLVEDVPPSGVAIRPPRSARSLEDFLRDRMVLAVHVDGVFYLISCSRWQLVH
mmetsp:Transcript_8570/g.18696  ORF Transcript_8570/g.18696 Transcript_8570/m.18696 type:complete len:234 (+) Transcript_8570:1590-2291(+)